jgi:hypothetical protein
MALKPRQEVIMAEPFIWSIAEQVVQDNATGMRFEFDATQATMPVLRIFTKDRSRLLVLMFAANGSLLKSDVRGVRDGSLEDVGQAAFAELHQDPAVADAATRAAADVNQHFGVGGLPVQHGGDAGEPNAADGSEFGDPNAPPPPPPPPNPAGEVAEEHPTKQQGVFYDA